METIEFIIEIIIGVSATIGMLFAGIFIGKEFGTLEKFFLSVLKQIKNNLNP